MKMIKCSMAFLLAVSFFALMPIQDAQAAGLAPGMCKIVRVGTMPGQNFIYADCPDAGYSNQYFRINDPAAKKELLATALTAVSLGADVRLWIEDDGSTCSRIYIYTD